MKKSGLSVVRSCGLGIAFLPQHGELLYFIKNECELGINRCGLSGLILCTLLFSVLFPQGDGVITLPPGVFADRLSEL